MIFVNHDHCFLNYWFRFLSPLSVVPVVTFAGVGLYHLGFPTVRISSLDLLLFIAAFSILVQCFS